MGAQLGALSLSLSKFIDSSVFAVRCESLRPFELSPFDDPVEGLLRVGVTLTVSTEQFKNNILSIWFFRHALTFVVTIKGLPK